MNDIILENTFVIFWSSVRELQKPNLIKFIDF